MVSPTRIPPAQASPARRPPRRMLRTVTSVSGPGSRTMSVAATVKVASAMSMAASLGRSQLHAALPRLRRQDRLDLVPRAEPLDQPAQVRLVQPADELRRPRRERVERAVAQPDGACAPVWLVAV